MDNRKVLVSNEEDKRFWREFGYTTVFDKSHTYKKSLPGRISRSLNLKIDILTHYGNGKLACMKCNFSDIRALSLDHIDGSGNKEHKRYSNYSIYTRLKRKNYPKGYQTLCMNCQFIKREENQELY